MEYNSFYGGRRGASFVIVKTYESMKEMIDAFSQGGSYKDVNYDEYVLISTPDRNSGDNGRLFRRGYNYNEIDEQGNPTGGAIFVGQISGPVGKAPQVELVTVDEVSEKKEQYKDNPDFQYRERSADYTVNNNSLLPGYYADEEGEHFNDIIHWETVSIRDNETNTETIAFIGFTVPYTVINYTTTTIEPYDDNGRYINNSAKIERTDDKSHPFFEQWELSIPKGIKGDSFQNFRIEGLDTNQAELHCDYYNYDVEKEPKPIDINLGDYRVITNIDISENGTLTIHYTNGDDDIFTENENPQNGILKWIESVEINERGIFTVKYNNGDEPYTTPLRWVTNISLNDLGLITLHYVDGTSETLEGNNLRWVADVKMDTRDSEGIEGMGDQIIKIKFNDDGGYKNLSDPINYIMATTVTSDYHYCVLYSDPARREALAAEESRQLEYNGNMYIWHDLGYVRTSDSIWVGKFFDRTKDEYIEWTDIPTIIEKLNELYPSGFTVENGGPDTVGKMAVTGRGEQQNDRQFFCFDYGTENNITITGYNGWKYLGEFQSQLSSIAGAEDDEIIKRKAESLVEGGLWFIVEEE